jgi:two-component sensor histidine kinase/sensor domain CHASE-containing protein
MDRAILARVEKQALFHRYPKILPLTLFALGMFVTLLFVLNIEQSDATARRVKLEGETAALATRLEREVSENVAYLKAAAALFSIADDVSQTEFASLVSDMSEDHKARGALGLGWAQWIEPPEIESLDIPVESSRTVDASDAISNRQIRIRPIPSDPSASMAVITMIEPLDEANFRALGYDMYSEPTRRVAMDQAVREGRPTASGKVKLIQDAGQQQAAGTLIYLPVFARRGPADLIRGPLKGFVYTPIRARDFLTTAVNDTPNSFGRVALYDGAVNDRALLAETGPADADSHALLRRLDFSGREWVLKVEASESRGLTQTSMFVLGFGLLASLLLMALARTATTRAAEDRKVLEWLQGQSSIRTSLTRELNHRVKNTLANVLSIVALTRRRSSDMDEFAEGLTGRIRALSATHDLLSQREWRNAPLYDVVQSELAPYLDPEDPHAEINGPDALLAPNDAMSLGLALHELATNAAKYGSLSVPTGKVSVSWTLPEPGMCLVTWRETGGPEVREPERRGFGMDLIEKIVSRELNAQVDIRFDPTGVTCTLAIPLRDQREFVLREGPQD